MSILEEEVAAAGRAASDAMDCGEHVLTVIRSGPRQTGVINVRGPRSDPLQTVNEKGGLRILSTQFAPEKPRCRSLSETHHIAGIILLLAAGQVEVSDQLR